MLWNLTWYMASITHSALLSKNIEYLTSWAGSGPIMHLFCSNPSYFSPLPFCSSGLFYILYWFPWRWDYRFIPLTFPLNCSSIFHPVLDHPKQCIYFVVTTENTWERGILFNYLKEPLDFRSRNLKPLSVLNYCWVTNHPKCRGLQQK